MPEVTDLPMVVDCSGGGLRNDEIQPPTDPILILTLKTQHGNYLRLPLSDRGVVRLWEAVAKWKQVQDFLSGSKPPGQDTVQ
jgi:hypothetical protein